VLFAAEFFGVPVEAATGTVAPRSRYKARTFDLSSLDEIDKHLEEGRPVVAACKLFDPESWYKAKGGVISLPADTSQLQGIHVITFVKVDPNEGLYVFANNWGANWGQDGFGSMTREVAQAILVGDQISAVEVKV
jgi:hypothetical protein